MCTCDLNYVYFVLLSGLHVTYNVEKRAGSRVVSVDARCLECLVPAYSPLDKDRVYSIMTNAFLIEGGDGYTMLRDEQLTRERFSKYMITPPPPETPMVEALTIKKGRSVLPGAREPYPFPGTIETHFQTKIKRTYTPLWTNNIC